MSRVLLLDTINQRWLVSCARYNFSLTIYADLLNGVTKLPDDTGPTLLSAQSQSTGGDDGNQGKPHVTASMERALSGYDKLGLRDT